MYILSLCPYVLAVGIMSIGITFIFVTFSAHWYLAYVACIVNFLNALKFPIHNILFILHLVMCLLGLLCLYHTYRDG